MYLYKLQIKIKNTGPGPATFPLGSLGSYITAALLSLPSALKQWGAVTWVLCDVWILFGSAKRKAHFGSLAKEAREWPETTCFY